MLLIEGGTGFINFGGFPAGIYNREVSAHCFWDFGADIRQLYLA